jgi:acetyl-CoA/propionyl-CoA carboxylase biotin carboxyl carrier protein
MIAKLIVVGADREHARRRMLRALDEFVIDGPTTLLGFHKALLSHECFIRGETCEGLVESEELAARAAELQAPRLRTGAGASEGAARVRVVEVDGRRFEVRVVEPEPPWAAAARRRRERVRAHGGADGHDVVVAPMQGTVLSVAVAEGDEVEAGQVICIVEAMKMENEVHAHRAGTVTQLSVQPGRPIGTGEVICVLG